MPFAYIDENGDVQVVTVQGQLLSNSCDATRNDNLLFAAVMPLEILTDEGYNKNEIKSNLFYDLIYYPDEKLADRVVDFGLLTSFSRELFADAISKGKIKKIASLSNIGYYLLLSKITVYLMRPESDEVTREKVNM